jgi:hypothetical protein
MNLPGNNLNSIPIKVEDAERYSIGSLRAILSEIATCLEKLAQDGTTGSIDLNSDLLERDVLHATGHRRLDHDICDRCIGTHQRIALLFFRIGNHIIVVAYFPDLARHHTRLAQSAVATTTSIIERHAGT